MKIIWIGSKRTVPKVGILQEGDVRDLPEDTARSLIKQGLAKAAATYKKNKKSKSKEK